MSALLGAALAILTIWALYRMQKDIEDAWRRQ